MIFDNVKDSKSTTFDVSDLTTNTLHVGVEYHFLGKYYDISLYLPLIFIGVFFVTCSYDDTPIVTKTIDTNSQEVISCVYALEKKCWENPNEIADIDIVIKEG